MHYDTVPISERNLTNNNIRIWFSYLDFSEFFSVVHTINGVSSTLVEVVIVAGILESEVVYWKIR